jgi:hypothetical protein
MARLLARDDTIDGFDLISGNDVDYGRSPAGIVANLEIGTVEDGFGTVDTVWTRSTAFAAACST